VVEVSPRGTRSTRPAPLQSKPGLW
jgi:hypothetical protein